MNNKEKNSNKCPICGRPTHKESKYCIFHASAKEKTEDEFKKALKEYIQEIKEDDKDYNFRRFIFIGDTDFKKDLNITILKNACFENAVFKGYVDFRGATFRGIINFQKAIFEEDAFFRKLIFKRGINFENAIFKMSSVFDGVIFNEGAYFRGVTFGIITNFMKAIFKEGASFRKAIFKGEVHFRMAIFKGKTEAYFMDAIFKTRAYFEDAIFEGGAWFRKAIFEGDAYFQRVTFKGKTYFEMVTFKEDANFEVKSFAEYVNFKEIRVLPVKKFILKVANNETVACFERAYLENTNLHISLISGALIDFTDTLLRNTNLQREQIKNHILQEKEKKFSEAKEIYLLLKNNFHSIGRYEDESWAFIKEKDMDRFSNSFGEFVNSRRRKSQFRKILLNIKKSSIKRIIVKFRLFKKWLFSKKAIKRFNLSVSNFIFQYGENPWYVIRFASIVILIFAVLLNISGIVKGDRTDLILQQIKEMQGSNVLKHSGPIIGNFLNCLYFSVVTFTTLGYGDFQPLEGWSRFLVSSEALLGAFTMALFVYTFARRTGGR